ncbi:hypothetical protein WN944_005789 [Citrus x changshan-huyou]|uniref:Protein kinase domain-containing protein n=1 Tax=Citrus x changshan-huyou TaxID=2935761 RepID=A0AAP0MK25_9ROSI
MSFNSEDFDVQPRRPILLSEELEKRWRSACAIVNNRRRRFRMVANLANHGEARKNKLERQEKLRDLFRAKRAALPLFDVAPSEYVTTYIPHDFQKAALDFTRSPDDVPSNEYNTQTRRFQEFVDDMGSIIKGHELKIMKRTNAVFSLRLHFFLLICLLAQEISLLSRFEHDNIVQYLGTDKGSLANLYQRYHLRDSQVSSYTRQILNGLIYLHDQNVVHRDIKCANILVDASGSVKLADFGLAKVVNLKNDGYGLTADIWSLGCTVLEMITHRPPYAHLEGMQALFRIGRGELPPVPNSLSRDARDFILKCLQVNPNDRPTAAQLMEHPFVKRPLQISRGSLAASPN